MDLEPVLDAGDEVVAAVTRRGVHRARARFQRDVLTVDDRHVLGQERVLQLQVFQGIARELAEHLALA